MIISPPLTSLFGTDSNHTLAEKDRHLNQDKLHQNFLNDYTGATAMSVTEVS